MCIRDSCTFDKAIETLNVLREEYDDIQPIMSERASSIDSRFGKSEEFVNTVEAICGKKIINTIAKAEPIGPKKLLDVLVICPCTGNTLAKMAGGITDSAVTMAAKSHLRNGRPVLIAVSTNDGLSGSAENIGKLLNKKNVYFVPFYQDDPFGKPCSLVADFERVPQALKAALDGRQIQPLIEII